MDVTKGFVEARKVIGIEVLDHLIVYEENFVSLKEKRGICNRDATMKYSKVMMYGGMGKHSFDKMDSGLLKVGNGIRQILKEIIYAKTNIN
ncbi:hypothetical protein E0M21_20930 [Bacillus cereus]|nr:hypothetical protein E0M21_20930 [Bacillus cereus]